MTLASISARPSRLDDVAGIIAERANPLAVRMVRQHLRSMGFIAVFTLLLFTALVTAILAATLPQAEAFGRGRWLYGILLAIWSACAVVAQPLMLVSAVRDERADSCWELLDLTGLHPLTVLSGMAWAAAVQQAVLMSAMAPFLIMAWLLRGLDPLLLLLTLLIVPIMGLTVTCMGMRGACSARKARFAGSALAYLLFLILIWLVMMWMLWASLHWRTLEEIAGLLRSGHAGAWATLAFLTMIALQAGMMGLVRAAMRISHPAGNRSTAPRALTWLCVGSFLVLLLALATFTRLTWSEALGWFAIIVAVRTMLSGSDALSEPYPLTPKQANWGTQWHGWRRPGFALLRPGAAAGRRCFLALAVLSLACGGVAWALPGRPYGSAAPMGAMAVGIICYAAIIHAIADAAARSGSGEEGDPRRHRLIVWSIVIGGTVLSALLLYGASSALAGFLSPLFGLIPFAMVASGNLGSSRDSGNAMAIVIFIGSGGLFTLLTLWSQATKSIVVRPLRARSQ